MFRFFTSLACAVFLTACTTSEQANQALDTRFTGSSTDAFFLAYGPPNSEYKMKDGKSLFTWSERAINYSVAGSVNTTVVGNTAYSTVIPGSDITVQCTLKILADPSGKIVNIAVLSDTIGAWQLSRCNEVFNRKPKKA